MGRSKGGDDTVVYVDLKGVIGMQPEQRVKWLAKACKQAREGRLKTSQLYDILSSKRIVEGLSDPQGTRMLRTLGDNLDIFSEKQQRYLTEASQLAVQFCADVVEPPQEKPRREKYRPPAKTTEDSVQKMEEMMARCRNFVRENASTFEERQKACEEQEVKARAEAARRQRDLEWRQIAEWHAPMEEWERSQMAALDDRAQQRAREAEAAKANAEKRKDDRSQEPRQERRQEPRQGDRSRSTKDDISRKPRPRDRSRSRRRGRSKDRSRKRDRRRRSSSSSS